MTQEDLYHLSVDDLEARVLGHWPTLAEACRFAKKCHEGQQRKNGGPYIEHPLRVALLIKETGGVSDESLACAALLHDVVEDTEATLEEVRERFGGRVGDLVRAVTLSKRPEGESRFEQNMQSFEGLRWEGRDALILRSADRLDNLTTARGAFSQKREGEYVRESREGLLPLTLSVNTPLYHALADAIENLDSVPAPGPGGADS
ncbi:MAG TPA: hypothetical protein DDW23_04020 [Planctomycetes bacterium]|nr:hypothetical protein [Planctomycetota bacterium]|tara:strand:+ start:612 stop:1223 length:612 start_codon:yes stop_codon:yes gene_type:complete